MPTKDGPCRNCKRFGRIVGLGLDSWCYKHRTVINGIEEFASQANRLPPDRKDYKDKIEESNKLEVPKLQYPVYSNAYGVRANECTHDGGKQCLCPTPMRFPVPLTQVTQQRTQPLRKVRLLP